MKLKWFVVLILLVLLFAFACNRYVQAGEGDGYKKTTTSFGQSMRIRHEQERLVNEELEKGRKE